eukprot:scaffold596715_cov32-Prasinocladus_malaysianus.AAC.1
MAGCVLAYPRSPEFAEPPERLAMYASTRSGQQQAVQRILRHMETARAMVPPAINPDMAEAWRVASAEIIAE